MRRSCRSACERTSCSGWCRASSTGRCLCSQHRRGEGNLRACKTGSGSYDFGRISSAAWNLVSWIRLCQAERPSRASDASRIAHERVSNRLFALGALVKGIQPARGQVPRNLGRNGLGFLHGISGDGRSKARGRWNPACRSSMSLTEWASRHPDQSKPDEEGRRCLSLLA